MLTVETELGKISVMKIVIGEIVQNALEELRGKVMISNHKGRMPGLVSKIGGVDNVNNMEISIGDNGLDVRIFVVIRFGTSITMVTNQLIDRIHADIEKMIGQEPNSVAVVVTGMISKNIAKRHIEVKR